MSTLLQKFLQEGGTPAQLTEKYAIKVRAHSRYPNLQQFKYDQIESPMGERLVQECRGIILDSQDNWRCVARPFDKFFNYDEGHAAKIDWSTVKVMEKLDGSLIIVYSYDGRLQVATSGTPDASGQVNGFGFTFDELFRRVLKEEYDEDLDNWNPRTPFTFMFELMTPYNRVVVRHEKPRIALIGVRHRETGQELPLDYYHHFPLPVVREFPLQTVADVRKTFEQMDPVAQEGYVICDAKFNRVKVKHPGYVAIHHARDGMSPKVMLEIIRTGERSEFLVHFPEWQETFNEVKARYDFLVVDMEESYEKHCHASSQKDFALAIKHVPFNGALFLRRSGKGGSFRQYLADVHIKHLVEHLKIKEVEL